jgi:flagellar biogenesis protein FliO
MSTVVPKSPLEAINKVHLPIVHTEVINGAIKTGMNGISSGANKMMNAGKSTSGKFMKRFSSIKNNYSSVFLYVFLLVLAILFILFAIWAFKKTYQTTVILATPQNIANIKQQQTTMLEKRWTVLGQGKTGITTSITIPSIPQDQQLLINTTVFSTRVTGYNGPYDSGTFDEDNAVRISLASGARCLILEIGRETDSYEPILIYRDNWGIKRSLNTGSIAKVAQSIASRAFNKGNSGAPPNISNDPMMVVLYFVDTPNAVKTPLEYIRFLAKVSEQIQPLANLIVGQTPQGDFRRQALESQLFYKHYTVFSQKVIILTNADTTPFRRLGSYGLSGEIGTAQDLDLLVHVRLYSRESPSGFGITSSPTNNINPAAVITSANYWINTPPDRIAEAQSQTKKAWTLVMTPVINEATAFSKDTITNLFTQYGVHSIPICLFDSPAVTNLYTGKGAPFETTAWVPKPALIQFIPPKPIVVQKAIPEADSGGGKVVAPSF